MKNVGHHSLTTTVNLKMSPRLSDNTKWLCCLLMMSGLPNWSPASAIAVKPLKGPATVEAQAKFFQDFFSVQLSPYKMEFGHVCEDPDTWEQRYEKKDFKNHRDMGKVRWGDKKGGYGEHYWDLNHAGHVGNHGSDDDDGSYNSHDHGQESNDPYDEPSEQVSSYNDEYDAEKSAQSPFDETNRAKRAHSRIKPDKDGEVIYGKRKTKDLYIKREPTKKKEESTETDKTDDDEHEDEHEPTPKYKSRTKTDKQDTLNLKYKTKTKTEDPILKYKPAKLNRYQSKEVNYDDDEQNPNQPIQMPLPEQQETQNAQYDEQPKLAPEARFVPYEDGAGVRQHQQQLRAAASTPRLFLDPSTGNVVDRTTGQAYVLQPIIAHY